MKKILMNKILFMVLAIISVFSLYAAAIQFGMTGAVKQKVKDLDAKVRAKKAETKTTTTTTVVQKYLSGVAAKGNAIASTKLSFKDANGVQKSVVTGTNGTYTIDVSTLTLPIILQIKDGTTTYYSVATASGTCNIHPFTDLIVRNWYKVQGTNVDAIFASTGILVSPPTETAVKVMELTVCNVLSELLLSVGIDSNNFSLITMPFSADNSAFDNVLVRTQVLNSAGGGITINVIDPNTGNTSGTVFTTAVPISTTVDPIATVTAEINAMLKNLVLTQSASYLTTPFLNDGMDATAFLAMIASANLTSATVSKIISYDDTNKTCAAMINIGSSANQGELIFSKASGSWQLSGDNQIAQTNIQFQATEGAGDIGRGYTKSLRFNVSDNAANEAASIASVVASGPGISTGMAVPCVADNYDGAYPPCGTEWGNGTTKAFEISVFGMMPALGSAYTLTLYMNDGSSHTYTSVIEAEYGFDPNGNIKQSDYPQYTLDAPITLASLLDGTTHYITGSVYVPVWDCPTWDWAPHFQFAYNDGNSEGGNFENQQIKGTFINAPIAGSSCRFTLTVPAVTTSDGGGTYTGTINGNVIKDKINRGLLGAGAGSDSILNCNTYYGMELDLSQSQFSSPRKFRPAPKNLLR